MVHSGECDGVGSGGRSDVGERAVVFVVYSCAGFELV